MNHVNCLDPVCLPSTSRLQPSSPAEGSCRDGGGDKFQTNVIFLEMCLGSSRGLLGKLSGSLGESLGSFFGGFWEALARCWGGLGKGKPKKNET